MTTKEIKKLSCEDCISILNEINRIKRNMIHKTKWEQKSANKEINALANELKTLLERIELD